MSYAMRWMLRVQPEDDAQVAALAWPSSSSAPPLRGHPSRHATEGIMEFYGMTWSWNGAEEDMRELSARFPSLLLVLDVHNAEEPGLYAPERWYFKAGKVHKVVAYIVFAEFDPAKLA